MRVRFTLHALAQLDRIFAYINERNPPAARIIKARILTKISRLAKYPHSATATSTEGVRMLAIGRYPYLVLYTVREALSEVWIIDIRHAKQERPETTARQQE